MSKKRRTLRRETEVIDESDWTANNQDDSELSYVDNGDIDANSKSLSIELKKYNEILGKSFDETLLVSLHIKPIDLQYVNYETDGNRIFNMLLNSQVLHVRLYFKNCDQGPKDRADYNNSLGLGLCLLDTMYRLTQFTDLPTNEEPPKTQILDKEVKYNFIAFLSRCSEHLNSDDQIKMASFIEFIRSLESLSESLPAEMWPNDDLVRFWFPETRRLLVKKDIFHKEYDAFVSCNGISTTGKILLSKCFPLLGEKVSIFKLDVNGPHFFPSFGEKSWQDESYTTVHDKLKQALFEISAAICAINKNRLLSEKEINDKDSEQSVRIADTYENMAEVQSLDDKFDDETVVIADTFEGFVCNDF